MESLALSLAVAMPLFQVPEAPFAEKATELEVPSVNFTNSVADGECAVSACPESAYECPHLYSNFILQ